MRRTPSVILVREAEGQVTGSGCCGRVEGDFLSYSGAKSEFAETRAVMERMGRLSQALRSRYGETVEIQVLDPRNVALVFILIRDFWTFRVGLAQALRTLALMPVQAVIVNGRLVGRGAWTDPSELEAIIDDELGEDEALLIPQGTARQI